MASYDSATLKVTELFSKINATANVCLWRLHGFVLDVIQLSAMGVAEIAESTNLKCPHTFVYIVLLHCREQSNDCKYVIYNDIEQRKQGVYIHFIALS